MWIEMAPSFGIADRVPRIGSIAGRREVTGPDWNLPVAVGDIQHECRLAEAGVAPAQRAHEILARGDARTEMRGAGRQIALMQVVGLDPALDQGAHERAERRR